MNDQLSQNTRMTLDLYVQGQVSNTELAEWLVQTEYDTAMPRNERDRVARLRLIVIEAEEGLRPIEEILQAVLSLLAKIDPAATVIAMRTSAATERYGGTAVTATASPVQHVGI